MAMDSVQRRGKQSSEAVAEVCRPQLLQALSEHEDKIMVCTIVPEPFRKCEDNTKNCLKEPESICASDDPSVFIVVDRIVKLATVRLHYPADMAEVKFIEGNLTTPVTVEMVYGVAVVAEQGKGRLCYIDFKIN